MTNRNVFAGVAGIVGLMLSATLIAQTGPGQKPAPKAKAKPAPAATEQAPKPPAPVAKPTDVKIRARFVSDAQISENTTYYQGPRQRVEFPGVVLITQCDLKKTIQINDKSKRYMVQPLVEAAPAPAAPAAPAAATSAPGAPGFPGPSGSQGQGFPSPFGAAFGQRGAAPQKPKGGVLTYTTTIIDTGERQTMLGSEARHIRLTTVKEASADACDKRPAKVETDGWYIDLAVHLAECESAPAPPQQPDATSCEDRTESRQSGDAKLGFAVATTVTTTEDKDVRTSSMEVVDLQITSLDQALFAVPAGYTEVKSQAELLAPSKDGSASGAGSTTLADALFGSLADGTRTVAPKRAGALRIGVVDPATTGGRDVSSTTLRTTLLRSMNIPPDHGAGLSFEAVPIQGATPADLEQDAQAKACDYVLTSDLAELKTSKPGKIGGFLKKASGEPAPASDVYDARVDFKLFSLADRQKPLLAANAKASSGGGGFGVGSALHLATWAGTMYMTMGMATMMGPMMSMNAMGLGGGGIGRLGMGSMMMGPAMSSAMSMMSRSAMVPGMGGIPGMGGMPGFQRPGADPALERTVSEACEKVGKTVTDELKKKAPAQNEHTPR
ncbi:MAG TPA: hypothetical protein VGY48_31425 [Vicinamibacterales bacterium]|nr:hypothetical protein [Vicinamibacterales bacterium]